MNAKSLLFAAVAAVVLIALAFVQRGCSSTTAAPPIEGEKLFPALLDRINDVAAIQVTSKDGTFRYERNERGWGSADKGGFPVTMDQVRKNLIGLAELEIVEAKTDRPESYSEIGVQDPGATDAKSKRVTLFAKDGTELASAILGNRKFGRGTQGVYVRRAGEERSWLARGEVTFPEKSADWLDKEILKVERKRVEAVRIEHPDGETLFVSKEKPEDGTYVVHDLPPDRELKYESVAAGMGGALEYLNLQDVVAAGDFERPEGEPVRSSFWTFGGLRVDVELWSKAEGDDWASFRASYDEAGPEELVVLGPLPPEEAAEAGEASASAEPKSPEEVRAEAEELNARVSPWVYKLAAYNKTNLTKRMSDLVKAPEPEPALGDGQATDAAPAGDDISAQLEDFLNQQGEGVEDAELEQAVKDFLQQQAGEGADGATGEDGTDAAEPPEEAPAGDGGGGA